MCSSHFIENMCALKKISKYYVVITMIEKCTFSVEIKKKVMLYRQIQVFTSKQILLFTWFYKFMVDISHTGICFQIIYTLTKSKLLRYTHI